MPTERSQETRTRVYYVRKTVSRNSLGQRSLHYRPELGDLFDSKAFNADSIHPISYTPL